MLSYTAFHISKNTHYIRLIDHVGKRGDRGNVERKERKTVQEEERNSVSKNLQQKGN